MRWGTFQARAMEGHSHSVLHAFLIWIHLFQWCFWWPRVGLGEDGGRDGGNLQHSCLGFKYCIMGIKKRGLPPWDSCTQHSGMMSLQVTFHQIGSISCVIATKTVKGHQKGTKDKWTLAFVLSLKSQLCASLRVCPCHHQCLQHQHRIRPPGGNVYSLP